VAPKGDPGPTEDAWELHNLTTDPEERHNRAATDADVTGRMRTVLESQRDEKRLLPS
jgi:hypothetical protein